MPSVLLSTPGAVEIEAAPILTPGPGEVLVQDLQFRIQGSATYVREGDFESIRMWSCPNEPTTESSQPPVEWFDQNGKERSS